MALLETDAHDSVRALLADVDQLAPIGNPEQSRVRLTLTVEVDGAYTSTRTEGHVATVGPNGWTA